MAEPSKQRSARGGARSRRPPFLLIIVVAILVAAAVVAAWRSSRPRYGITMTPALREIVEEWKKHAASAATNAAAYAANGADA